MGPLRLLGLLIVIVLIGFIIINIVLTIVEKLIEFAETNPWAISGYALIILVILLGALLQPG
jgi:hypothetical protein